MPLPDILRESRPLPPVCIEGRAQARWLWLFTQQAADSSAGAGRPAKSAATKTPPALVAPAVSLKIQAGAGAWLAQASLLLKGRSLQPWKSVACTQLLSENHFLDVISTL